MQKRIDVLLPRCKLLETRSSILHGLLALYQQVRAGWGRRVVGAELRHLAGLPGGGGD
jgi:hypothetical protein